MQTSQPPLSNVTLVAAAARHWPVIIVGAGIAGASAAFALAERGVHALLIDRSAFPRAKTCGGCLNPRTVASLERLGLGDVLASLQPNRIEGVEWRTARGRQAVLPFPATSRERACAVSRTALDAALIKAAMESGAAFLSQTRALDSRVVDGERLLRVRGVDAHEVTLRAGIVLACDGLASALARGARLVHETSRRDGAQKIGTSVILPGGALSGAPDQRILMACSRDGYVGAVRVEKDQWDVAAAIRLSALRGGVLPSETALRILSESGILCNGASFEETHWTVTPPRLTRRVVRPYAERLLLVGDAAGYVEPITGEGMAWALAAVESVVPIVCDGWGIKTGKQWEAAWRARVKSRTRLVRFAAGVAASPLATEIAVASLAAAPGLGRMFAAPLFRESASVGATT